MCYTVLLEIVCVRETKFSMRLVQECKTDKDDLKCVHYLSEENSILRHLFRQICVSIFDDMLIIAMLKLFYIKVTELPLLCGGWDI